MKGITREELLEQMRKSRDEFKKLPKDLQRLLISEREEAYRNYLDHWENNQ